MEMIFKKVAKFAVYLLVFLLPLFFLPWTSNVLEFSKQALLLILVLLSLICWLAASIFISNRLEINTDFLNLPVLVLLLISGVSVIFSLSKYGSFWGWPLVISSSFLSLLCFVVLYFIIVNLFKKEELPFLFLTIFLSGIFLALFFVLQIFGKFIFPIDFSRNISFNTVGSPSSLAIYFSLLLILLFPLLFFVKRFFKIILGISGALLLFCLVLINFQPAWLILTFGLAVLFTFGIVSFRKIKSSGLVTFLMVFLIISLIFTFFRFSLPGIPNLSRELSPGQGASFKILQQLPLKSLILGSGPGTFFYDWAKYKSPDTNQTIRWGVRFFQASSEILDRIITQGILGILAFFFLLAVSLKSLFGFLLKNSFKESSSSVQAELFLAWGILAGLFGLLVAFFLYPVNLSILFLFWLLVSFTALLTEKKKQIWVLQALTIKALGASFLSVLILISGIGLAILYGQKYVAEVRYLQGLAAWQRGKAEESSNYILRAANLNPKMDLYWRDLSQISLFRLNNLLANTSLSQEDLTSRAQALIADAINSASQATAADPNNVANWNIRGFVYQNMLGIVGGVDEWAVSSYKKAAELEPSSPYVFTEMGRTYLVRSDLLEQQAKAEEKAESLRLAQESFDKAISLKSDYAPARFLTAMVSVREGKMAEAIARLEETKQVVPFDTGLAFQLGLIYYNDNQFDKAKAEFERAVLVDPNYSNARYFLGLIYDRQGNKKEATLEFEKIEELNPDNQEVKKILANLRAGKPALEGVVPGEPPVEEKPEEQLEK